MGAGAGQVWNQGQDRCGIRDRTGVESGTGQVWNQGQDRCGIRNRIGV